MSRVSILALTVALAAALTTPAWSQPAQTGQAGTAVGQTGPASASFGDTATPGSNNVPSRPATPGVPAQPTTPGVPGTPSVPGTSAAAQTAIPGQSGTISDFGPTGQRQGQFTPDGRPVHGGQPASSFNRTGFNNIGGGVINRTPWFGNLAVRRQLQLNALQYDQLNRAYQDAWTSYNQGLTNVPSNLVLAERARRLQALQHTFDNEFNRSLNTTLVNPQQRRQFNQIRWQYQGSGASVEPRGHQSLNLSPEQQRRLRLMAHQWNQQMQRLREQPVVDSSLTLQEFNDLRHQAQEQFESVLMPEQLRIWPELIGDFYDFPWDLNGVTDPDELRERLRQRRDQEVSAPQAPTQ